MLKIALHNRGIRIFDYANKKTIDLDYVEGLGFLIKFNEYPLFNEEEHYSNIFFTVEKGLNEGDNHQAYAIFSRLYTRLIEYYNSHRNNEALASLGFYDAATGIVKIISDADDEKTANKLLINNVEDNIILELERTNTENVDNNMVIISEKKSKYGKNFAEEFANTKHMLSKIARPFDDVIYKYYGYDTTSKKR